MLKLFRLIKPYRGYVAIVLVLAVAQSTGTINMALVTDRGPQPNREAIDEGLMQP